MVLLKQAKKKKYSQFTVYYNHSGDTIKAHPLIMAEL